MSDQAKRNLYSLIKKWESLKKTTYLARVARHWVGRAVAVEAERNELRRRVEQLVVENARLNTFSERMVKERNDALELKTKYAREADDFEQERDEARRLRQEDAKSVADMANKLDDAWRQNSAMRQALEEIAEMKCNRELLIKAIEFREGFAFNREKAERELGQCKCYVCKAKQALSATAGTDTRAEQIYSKLKFIRGKYERLEQVARAIKSARMWCDEGAEKQAINKLLAVLAEREGER